MQGIARYEHQIADFHSPGLFAYLESAFALQHQHELVVIRLEVNDICIRFETLTLHERCSPSHKNVRLRREAAFRLGAVAKRRIDGAADSNPRFIDVTMTGP